MSLWKQVGWGRIVGSSLRFGRSPLVRHSPIAVRRDVLPSLPRRVPNGVNLVQRTRQYDQRLLGPTLLYRNTILLDGGLDARLAAPFFLAPLLAFLKSSTALKALSVVSRVAFTIATPLRLRARYWMKLWHGPDYAKLYPPSKSGRRNRDHRHSSWRHPYFKRTTLAIMLCPVALLFAGIAASLERTPVWGRWRIIMMSDDEEAMLVEEFLRPGTYQKHYEPTPLSRPDSSKGDREPAATSKQHTHVLSTAPRDWLTILRVANGEPVPSASEHPQRLLGIPVLEPRTDWRASWVRDVLIRLEDAVERCGIVNVDVGEDLIRKLVARLDKAGYNTEGETPPSLELIPPLVDYPLAVRPALLQGREDELLSLDTTSNGVTTPVSNFVTRYGLLVLDDPNHPNAFSLGFGPALAEKELLPVAQEAPGVIVMYTGLLNEILYPSYPPPQLSPSPPPLPVPVPPPPPASGLFGIFSRSTSQPSSPPSYSSSTNPPTYPFPTSHQTDQLAAMLAHELAHLLLSHSLEAWASSSMYGILQEFTTDMIRTVLYPLTSVLGPLFNDWFAKQVRTNAALGLTLASSCNSRRAEVEADLLALRLLWAAGFDVKSAVKGVWGEGGVFERIERKEREGMEMLQRHEREEEEKGSAGAGLGRIVNADAETSANDGDGDDGVSDSWLSRAGFLKTHPGTNERHRRIVEELRRWSEEAELTRAVTS